MYNYYFCSEINDEFYDHKLDKNKLKYFIDRYKLISKGLVKEYWLNNVNILSNDGSLSFRKIIDNTISYKNKYLIHNYDINECVIFNFYESHLEDEYILYEKIYENIKIIIKEYTDYITLHYESENIINNNKLLYYNNI
tara:strand:+ start:267 stop:683 length:417 start_codon:yes stop_codon:yes gene_type:complete